MIAEILCDRRSRLGSFITFQRRFIGSRHNNDRTPHSLFSEVSLYKFPHFPASFSDQCDHIDVRFCIAGKHTH